MTLVDTSVLIASRCGDDGRPPGEAEYDPCLHVLMRAAADPFDRRLHLIGRDPVEIDEEAHDIGPSPHLAPPRLGPLGGGGEQRIEIVLVNPGAEANAVTVSAEEMPPIILVRDWPLVGDE